ncbi:MAG: LptF/LptG family permease [Ignavibacteriaceae bacterium]
MILYKYILKNHFIPFVFSTITLMCIFILQFMMKFADRLVGKGLSTWIIIKLISFNLAWMVVLVIPMATLVATLMAFGNMAQNNEITIMKSSGVSLYKMMLAPLLASTILCYLLFLFNNDVLPDANHEAKILGGEISRLKPTLSLEPGVFSQEVPNYAILVRGINNKTNKLSEITIYDYSTPGKVNIVTAKSGEIFFSNDQTKLIMSLHDGEIHESDVGNTNLYRKLIFKKHRITMDAEQFSFQQSNFSSSRGERELSTSAMRVIVDSLSLIKESTVDNTEKDIKRYFFTSDSVSLPASKTKPKVKDLIYSRILNNVNNTKNIIISDFNRIKYWQDQINKYLVEIYKKYAIPVACIVFILIGAPLGTMTKKGGFGIAASISLFFFLIYWACLIGGEKLADRSLLSPFMGMWIANILLGMAGIFLTYKTVKETITLDFSWIKKLLPKQWREIQEKEEEMSNEDYR